MAPAASRRLLGALAVSLLLHAALGGAWWAGRTAPSVEATEPAAAPLTLVWAAAPAVPGPPPAPTAQRGTPDRPTAATPPPRVRMPTTRQSTHATLGPAGPQGIAAAPDAPPVDAAAPAVATKAPPASAPVDPLAIDVARALAREQAWQRRQGALPPAGGVGGPGAPRPLGAQMQEQALHGAGGTRLTRVSGPAGDYCVELPSADQLPALGAAPRLAPTRTCR